LAPAALVRAFRYTFVSRDEGADERIAFLVQKDRAWGRQRRFWCTKVCPKEIPVTKEINQIKKNIIDSKKSNM